MNLWWPPIAGLGLLWVAFLVFIKLIGVTWPCFVLLGSIWAVVFVFSNELYDFGTNLLRKANFTGLADWRARTKPRVMGPVRFTLGMMAAASFLAALF